MKYCQYCGTQLADEANFCTNCGKATSQPTPQSQEKKESTNTPDNKQELVTKLSERLKTNGIIWIVIACIQILIGLAGAWFTLIVGILNIISAITNIKVSKRILTNQNGIVRAYEPVTNAIIALVYNLVIGGVIGVLGSVYYLVFVRGFVMENREQFLAMETDEPQTTNDNAIHMDYILTEEEALRGVTKDVSIEGLSKTIKVSFPKKMQEGYSMILRGIGFPNEQGVLIKKDVVIKIHIQKTI